MEINKEITGMSIKPRINIASVSPMAQEAARISEERIGEINQGMQRAKKVFEISFIDKAIEGFVLDIDGEKARITAGKTREFIAGVGKLVSLLRKAMDNGGVILNVHIEDIPRYPARVNYMPSHFGNPFECAWPGEMQRYLEDLALGGASGYGDWFDPNDMPDPYNPYVYCSTSMSLWKKKKEFLRISKRLGLDNIVYVAHNVGFVDQMRPEWVGKRSHEHRVQGQVLCPSIPEARQVCLKNHDNLFRDLAESGIEIDTVICGPYDDGGCACDKCQPYYPTFLSMLTDIYRVIRKYYPNIKIGICGWWTTENELNQVINYYEGIAKNWFESFQFSATYNVFKVPEDIRKSIGSMPLSIFFHIGFSNDDRDVYIKSGIHSAPTRIKSVLNSFDKVGCKGFYSYIESYGDHFNEYICNILGRNPDADTRELAYDYCRQMYNLRGKNLDNMVDVLFEMEFLEKEKAEKWVKKLEEIEPFVKTPPYQSWAFAHVLLKARLMALDYEIEKTAKWESKEDIKPVLPLIKKRLELSEKLWREVYGLGVLRHGFIPECMMPEWYKNYIKIFPQNLGRIRPGSMLSKDA